AFYSRALRGFAATLTPASLAKLAADPLVLAIEQDDPFNLKPLALTVEPRAEVIDWGMNKIGATIDSTRSGDSSTAVHSTSVYVIDTGVDSTHPDVNLVGQVNFVPEDPDGDCNGHGTAVAGIIAGRGIDMFTVGVAPGAPVTGVK